MARSGGRGGEPRLAGASSRSGALDPACWWYVPSLPAAGRRLPLDLVLVLQRAAHTKQSPSLLNQRSEMLRFARTRADGSACLAARAKNVGRCPDSLGATIW